MAATGGEGMNVELRRRTAILLLLALGVASFGVLSLALGSVPLTPAEVASALFMRDGGEPAAGPRAIVRQFRLPKMATAMLAGAALAVSGLLMQTLFRNPLAGPFVLGISAGASLGVALVVLAAGSLGAGFVALSGGASGAALVLAASAGAGAVLLLVLLAANRVSPLVLLILGVLFGYAAGAVVTVLLHLAAAEQVQAYVVWTFGSFGSVTPDELRILAPVVVLGLAIAATTAKPLDALAFGADAARSLGVRTERVKARVVVATALLAGAVTAYCGPVGFIGVAVPHLARGLLATGDHRWLMPGCALAGAWVALASDLVAQLPGRDGVLPLNAVTALVGAPVLAWVVLRRRGENAWS